MINLSRISVAAFGVALVTGLVSGTAQAAVNVPVSTYAWVYASPSAPTGVPLNTVNMTTFGGGIYGNLLAVANASTHSCHSFLTFDLSSVSFPTGSTATLHLYSSPDNANFSDLPNTSNAVNVVVRPLTSALNTGTVSYLNQPTASSDNSLSSVFLCDGVAKDFSVDITPIVSAWKSGSLTNNGIRLEVQSPSFTLPAFASGTDTMPAPYIAIQSVPEPTASLAVAGSVLGLALRRSRR
jgi:hypothetical protein